MHKILYFVIQVFVCTKLESSVIFTLENCSLTRLGRRIICTTDKTKEGKILMVVCNTCNMNTLQPNSITLNPNLPPPKKKQKTG